MTVESWRAESWRAEAASVASRCRPPRWDPAWTGLIEARINAYARRHEQLIATAVERLERLAVRLVRDVLDGRITRQDAARRFRAAAEQPDPMSAVYTWLVPPRISERIARSMRTALDRGERCGRHRHHLR